MTIGGGAVIEFPDGPQPGETITGASPYSIKIRVRTPPYARIERLLAYFNGALLWEKTIENDVETIIDFDETVTLDVPRDGHVTFLALGEPSLEYIKPGHIVFAMSNPIWLDADGAGVSNVGQGLSRNRFSFCR